MNTTGKIILTIIVVIIAVALTAVLPGWSKIISIGGCVISSKYIWKD